MRIIPAFAGNTVSMTLVLRHFRDHPRIRGEHTGPGLGENGRLGSSPHSRGTRPGRSKKEAQYRIIPAFAGNTHSCLFRRLLNRDHPRIRGEHRGWMRSRQTGRGSSPHSRGTRTILFVVETFKGIIPAFAGNTLNTPGAERHPWDHPRIRGEHLQFNAARITH